MSRFEDKTFQYIAEFLKDEDFLVHPLASRPCRSHEILQLEKTLNVRFPVEYKAHVLGEIYGGVRVEAVKAVWPDRTGGKAWMFCSGLYTYSPSPESEPWAQVLFNGRRFINETGLHAVPILKVYTDSDVYCVNENGDIVQFDHEQHTLQPINLDFWTLLDQQLTLLRERKDKMKKQIGLN